MAWKEQQRQNEFKAWMTFLPYRHQLKDKEIQELWTLYDAYRYALEVEKDTFDRVMHCSSTIDYKSSIEQASTYRMECKNALSGYLKQLSDGYGLSNDSIGPSKAI